jgi:O-antigen/teichoic acid export membrane protein
MSVHAATLERRSASIVQGPALVGTWLVAGATVGSGLLTYIFLVVAARSLGAEQYGQIGVLWGAIFIAAIVLFRPLEQTTSRAIAHRLARGLEVRTVLRSVSLIGIGILALGVAGAVLGWSTISDRLFRGDNVLTAMLFAGTVAYGLSYLVRGVAGGVCWFKGYSLGLLADSASRLVLAAPLVVVASRNIAALALVGGGLVGAAVPFYAGRRQFRRVFEGTSGANFRLRQAAAFAGPAAAIAAADQVLVNGGPLLVVASGGASATKAAGVVFAATMLVRAPVYVFQGIAAALLPNLTRLQAGNETASFRRAVVRTSLVLTATGALIVSATAVAGPAAMRLYGSGFAAGRTELVLLATGVACYLAAGAFSQALLSLDGGVRAAAAWTIAAGVFVGYYAGASGAPLWRVSSAFAVAMATVTLLVAGLLAERVRGS